MDDTINLQPTLDGPRLVVRPVVAEDWKGMFAVAADPLVWEQHPAKSRYQEAEFREFFDAALACKSAFTFVEKDSDKIIGSSRYNGYDADKSEIEIGWTFLGRGYWGGRYNAEVKKLMLEHAFTFVDTVVFWIGADNMRSRKAVEKIGGKLRDGIQQRGHGQVQFDYVVYEIAKKDYVPPH